MRMVEVVYAHFMSQLKTAATSGNRIEKSDKAAWKKYVQEHKVYEAACRVHAKALAEPVKAVILNTDDEWAGYYLYSPSDEIAMKYSLD